MGLVGTHDQVTSGCVLRVCRSRRRRAGCTCRFDDDRRADLCNMPGFHLHAGDSRVGAGGFVRRRWRERHLSSGSHDQHSRYSGTGSRIDEVAVKIASAVDKTSLVNAPGDLSYWRLLTGGLNADGCSGTGSGFECSDWKVGSPGGATLADSDLFTWTFDIDINGPLFNFTSNNTDLQPSIKARYVDDSGKKVGALVSEKVPEPATLGLLAVGMSVAAIRRRREGLRSALTRDARAYRAGQKNAANLRGVFFSRCKLLFKSWWALVDSNH